MSSCGSIVVKRVVEYHLWRLMRRLKSGCYTTTKDVKRVSMCANEATVRMETALYVMYRSRSIDLPVVVPRSSCSTVESLEKNTFVRPVAAAFDAVDIWAGDL